MRKLICLSTLLISFSDLFAQKDYTVTAVDTSVIINYIPKYSWSAGVEYSFLPTQISDGSWVPDNYEIQAWLGKRWYLQVGAFAQYGAGSFDNYFFNNGFGLYAGITMKLFLFNKFYFTPAWNIYYDQTSKKYTITPPGWTLTTGPTMSFEYFPINRLSVRMDFLNYNYGFYVQSNGNSGGQFTMHRGLGVGIRYNFDLNVP